MSGMIEGEKGVKYGLHLPSKKPAGQAPQKLRPAAKAPNIFGEDSDSDEDVGKQVARQAAKKRSEAKVQDMYAAALAEDPTVFDYDGVYDKMTDERAAPRQKDKAERQSKYIGSLMLQAQERKREQDIAYERQLLKERRKEDHMFEGKERFITTSYRRKLEEDKLWQEQQRLKDAAEEAQAPTKLGHMGNFYRNLLTKNVAFGGGESGKPGVENDSGGEAAPLGGGEARLPSEAERRAMAKREAELDEYERLRLQAERTLAARTAPAGPAGSVEPQGQGQGQGRGQEQEKEEEEAGTAQQEEATVAEAPGGLGDNIQSSHLGTEASEPTATGATAIIAGKRRNDDTSILSARERYLARKRQKGAG